MIAPEGSIDATCQSARTDPFTVKIAVESVAGGLAGGYVGYGLFSGAYEELWEIIYE